MFILAMFCLLCVVLAISSAVFNWPMAITLVSIGGMFTTGFLLWLMRLSEAIRNIFRPSTNVNQLSHFGEFPLLGFAANCPKCRRARDFFVWLTTGLGPSRLQCPVCGAIYSSWRTEWTDMTASQRVWCVIRSVLLIAGLGFAGGCSTDVALSLATSGKLPESLFTLDGFVPGAVVWAPVGVVMMIYRIARSTERKNRSAPYRPRLFDFQIGVQAKLGCAVVLPPVLTWIAYVVLGEPLFQR